MSPGFHALLETIRAEVSGERALDSVRALARFHRVQASPGYDQAAAWLAGQLERYSLVPSIETVPGDGRTRFLGQLMPEGWECTRARANLIDGTHSNRICDDAEPLSLILRSAPARGRFPLVAVAGGAEPDDYRGVDVRGAMVLCGDPVYRVLQLAVRERGAAGLLFDGRRLLPPVRDRFDDPDQIAYTSFWWAEDEPRGFGFVVSPRVGAGLRERLRTGARLEVDVEIESRRFETAIPLVSAVIPGRTDREILLIAHLCHPRPSANDNASGASAVLEAARVLKECSDRGKLGVQAYGIRFLWVPELTGTYAWLGRDPERAARTVAALNLDMVGEDQEQCGSTFLLERPPCFAGSFTEELLARIRAQAVDWVPSFSGPGHFSMTRMAEVPYSGGSDHAVLNDPAIGIPCPMLIQWPDRFYHSSHDTPDRCDPGSLALAARCAATYAGFLASAGPPERAWLLGAVARGARRRLLAALDEPDPARGVARERVRASRALASLARVGVEPQRLQAETGAFEAFAAREAAVGTGVIGEASNDRRGGSGGVGAAAAGRVPRRLQRAPLDYQRHLIAGYRSLPPDERERWRTFERSVEDSGTFFELAWYACDGSRDVAAIAECVHLETGRSEPEAIAAFFEWTDRLGLSEPAVGVASQE